MSSYASISERFAVFRECLGQEGKGIRAAAERLVAAYESDLDVDIVDELTDLGKPAGGMCTAVVSTDLNILSVTSNY